MSANSLSNANLNEPQHSLVDSIALHLLPGVLIAAFYLLTAPTVMAYGFPPMFALLLAILFVAIPVELGELYRRGWKYNRRLSLAGIIGLRQTTPTWQYFVFSLVFVVLAVLVSGAAGLLEIPINTFLTRWIPAWLFLNDLSQYAGYSRQALLITLVVNLVLNGTAAPIIEELYFRGFLLPRLSRFGRVAPLLHAALFTIYHFWQPYNYLAIFLELAPLVYVVWRKQNYCLGIALHVALNVLGNLFLFGGILGGSDHNI